MLEISAFAVGMVYVCVVTVCVCVWGGGSGVCLFDQNTKYDIKAYFYFTFKLLDDIVSGFNYSKTRLDFIKF